MKTTKQEWEELMEFATKRFVSTKNRMDVENAIQQVRNSVDDLSTFIEMYIDHPNTMTEDDVWNYIDGIRIVLQLRVENLWNAHIQREHIDGYGTLDEVVHQRVAQDETVPKKKGKKK